MKPSGALKVDISTREREEESVGEKNEQPIRQVQRNVVKYDPSKNDWQDLWAKTADTQDHRLIHRPVRAITRERLGLRRARWYAGGSGLVAGSIIRVPRE